jgi:CO/xanthine dehydrogenase Mo-binding subunit
MGPAAAILNAISDALEPLGVQPLSCVPATPERVWGAIKRARQGRQT